MRPFIVIGDKTGHGGVVVQGSPTNDAYGKGIARVGDRVTCPRKGHGGTTVIVSGDPTFLIDGQPVARHGDLCACGAKLLSSQVVAYVVEGSLSAGGGATDAGNGPGAAPVPLDYDEQVELFAATAFAPGVPFYIRAGDRTISGRVGEDRRLPRVDTATEDRYQVWVGDDALVMIEGGQ